MTKEEKIESALEKFKDARWMFSSSYSDKFEDFSFAAGHQYTKDEIDALENANPPRPAYVWNMVLPAINLVTGIFHQNPVKVKAMPREEGDQFLADILNDAMDFVDDDIGAEPEEMEAVEDSAICGSGYVSISVNVDPKRPSEIKIEERVRPFYQVWRDPAGMRDDGKDWRYVFEEIWMSLEDFKVAFPKFASKAEEIMEEGYIEIVGPEDTFDGFLEDDRPSEDFDRPLDVRFYDQKNKLIRVIRMQYWANFTRYFTLEGKEITPEEYREYKKINQDFRVVEIMDQKVKWLEFTRDEVLFDDDSPIPYDGFSIVPMFWSKDKSEKGFVTHYGVTRPIKDPNREVNKRWSMALDSLVSQGQGVMAEMDAFVDIRQAEDSWSDPRQITWVNKGALSQGKVKEKPGLMFPAAAMEMEKMAQEVIKTISGLNPNLMGETGSKGESGVVIKLRIQQGLTLLAKAFASYKRMKAELFRIKAAIIMKYMPESQLRRILGNTEKYRFQNGMVIDEKRGIAAPLRNIKDLEYNIKVEDAPGNINKSMAELAIFMQMMKSGFPVDPEQIIKKLDLSAGEKADWIRYIQGKEQEGMKMKQMQVQAQQQAAQVKAGIEQAKLQLKGQEVQGKLQLDAAKIQQQHEKEQIEAMADLAAVAQRQKEAEEKIALELAKLNAEQRAQALQQIKEFLVQYAQGAQRLTPANRVQYGSPPKQGATGQIPIGGNYGQ